MTSKTDDVAEGLSKRLLECLEELDDRKVDLDIWTDSLEELSEIVDAFRVDKKNKIQEKTVLDVGTDCVKPLYIALKFEPQKIIGINEDLSPYSFASDIEKKSKLLTKTKIRFYDCSLFDEQNLNKILRKEKEDKFDFVLVSKTLHHLRTGKCIVEEHKQKQEHPEDEGSCIYKFEEQKIFKRLLQYGKRVIVYEPFDPEEDDDDKVRGRGGYFTKEEMKHMFEHLSEHYRVEFIKPLKYRLTKSKLKKIESKFRQVDYVCFYVEEK
jgi:SAM-dependent methyltransferase